MSSIFKKYGFFLFSKPLIAASVVGSSIHLLLELNSHFFLKTGYFSDLSQLLSNSFPAAFFKFVIPFTIPFLITSIGNRLMIQNERTSLIRFPQANPDIIVKLDRKGEFLFINQTGEEYIKSIGFKGDEKKKILPDNCLKIIESIIGSDKSCAAEKELFGRVFDYKFKSFVDEDTVFVTGHEISKQKKLESSITHANYHMTEIMGFFDQTIALYHNRPFNIQEHYEKMLGYLLRDLSDPVEDKPTHIFLSIHLADGKLQGNIYRKEKDKIIADSKKIIIDPAMDKVAIFRGEKEVVFSNWEKDADSIADFQKNFHPDVRKRVGTIERFATYQSGDVALIAFYKGKLIDIYDAYVLKSLATYSNSLKILFDKGLEIENAFIYTIEALARAAEANDEDTGDHIIRVNEYSMVIAEAMELSADFVKTIHYSAQMHDVGKIHVDPQILKKPGKLTQEEFEIMKNHTRYGKKILGNSVRLCMATEIAHNHHETWDGKGYPRGIKGEEIPLSARIVKLADVYDALRQQRVYKPSFSHSKAVDIIVNGDGRVNPEDFDPSILKVFEKIKHKFDQIYTANLLPTA